MRLVKIFSLLVVIFAFSLGISNAQQGLILTGFSRPETLGHFDNEIIADFNVIDYQSFSIQLEPPVKATLQIHMIARMRKVIDISV